MYVALFLYKMYYFSKIQFLKKKRFSDGLSGVAVSCFIAAEYLLVNRIKHFL